MRKLFSSLLIFLLILSSIPFINHVKADGIPLISIKLKNYLGNQMQLTLTVKGEYDIPNSHFSLVEGKTYSVKVENGALSLYENDSFIASFPSFSAIPKVYGASNYIFINNRPYLGTMQFSIENSTIVRPTNTLPLEDYLKGVVPFEMIPSWNTEALKAQAVAARTYAERNESRGLDDTIGFQVYGGYAWNSNSSTAVDATASQTLTYNGTDIDAFYSASNGGITESNANVWGGAPLAIYPIKADPYDKKVPWSFNIRKTQIDITGLDRSNPQNWWGSVNEADSAIVSNIKNWMYQNGYQNNEIKIISVPVLSFSDDKTTGGRVKYGSISLQFFLKDKASGSFVMDSSKQIKVNNLSYTNTGASLIRAMVGGSNMRSYLVNSFTDNGTAYSVSGFGDGHGVGMSQWGAKIMADQGVNYQDILNFYFPGTTLTNTNSAAVYPESTAAGSDTSSTGDNQTGSVTNTSQSSEVPITVIETTTPAIANVNSSYASQTNQITIDYSLNEAARTTVYVKNPQGAILDDLLQNSLQNAGSSHFVYDASKLSNGNYYFGIIATDLSGNRSSVLKGVTINKSVSAPSVNPVSDKDIVVIGSADANAKLTISSGMEIIGNGTANAAGKYTITIPKQTAGTKLSIVAKDSAGNVSSPAAANVLDKTAPRVPKVFAVSNLASSLTGLTEGNAVIIVKIGSKVIGRGKADRSGKFRVYIPKQKAKTVLTVTAQDSAGNISPAVSFKVLSKK